MTNTMTRTEELQSIYWDMYKDAHGIRPRHVDTTHWTEEMFVAEFEALELTIRQEELQRAFAEGKAIERFEARVDDLMATGAQDRATAIRWIMDAEGADGDTEYADYLLGLPYGYISKIATKVA
ncbi:MAG: hypothetical protein EBU08_12940 [Micrococcales bacterium]|nr:hypothetical protein [Micrococcales bacterium]